MTNIIRLRPRRQREPRGVAALSVMFATQRRAQGDVFWLKENAEWLGILASMKGETLCDVLEPYEAFYQSIPTQLEFFPQYYRFFLSLCLDIEDLGMHGDQDEALCHWVAKRDLPEAELSDLQRGEAMRLLKRRGVVTAQTALTDRLHRFMARPETFALPNQKAAYELAHIIFYLSDYGRRDPALADATLTSLHYAGLLAYLDQNSDLLAEICAALRFAGATPSPIWERLVQDAHAACHISGAAYAQAADGYHGYLVTGWLAQIAGNTAFLDVVPAGQVTISGNTGGQGPLRRLSASLFGLGAERSADWSRMRENLLPGLSLDDQIILEAAEQSTPCFEAFFEGFARASDGGATLFK